MDYVRRKPALELEHANPRHFLKLDEVYLGISAQETMRNIKQEPTVKESDIEMFHVTCLNFYIELVSQIKTRFDFADPLYDFLQWVDPKEAQKFNVKSLSFVLERFPCLKNDIDAQKLGSEWKLHALTVPEDPDIDVSKPATEYWKKVFLVDCYGHSRFPEFKKKLLTSCLFFPFQTHLFKGISLQLITDYYLLQSNWTIIGVVAQMQNHNIDFERSA